MYLITEFTNYMLTYIVIFGANRTKSKKKIVLGLSILAIIHLGLLFFVNIETSSDLSMVSMLIIPLLFLKNSKKKLFLVYPFVVLGTSIIGISISFIMAVIFEIPYFEVIEGNIIKLICQSVPGIILLLIYIYRKFKGKRNIRISLDNRQYILFYIVSICLFLMIAPLQMMATEIITKKNINIIGCSISVACIVLVIITVWQAVVVKREAELKEQSRMNQKIMLLQKEYYDELLKQDEKMRRFRHDMNYHIIALQTYCKDKNQKGLEKYLDQIVLESDIYKVKKYTGNKIVDAIIYKLDDEATQDEVKVVVKGKLSDEVSVSAYDLCVVISNLLKNSIEACKKNEKASDRKSILRIGTYNKKIYIFSKNKVKNNIIMDNKYPKSSKGDNVYHGLGFVNIENTIKKYKGTLEYKCENGYFEVEVGL